MPPQLDWLLSRALGPVDSPASPPHRLAPDDPILRHLSNDFWGRLSLRLPEAELRGALGSAALAAQRANRWRIAARMIRHQEVCRRLGALGERLGTPLVFLKGMALHLGGHAAAGTRLAMDVDVLVDPAAAPLLFDELRAQGGQPWEVRATPHHLPPIRHPLGSEIELHVELPGTSLDGRGHATAAQVVAAELTTPIDGFGPACHLPRRDLLAAHLLAHAISQHGAAPQGPPPTRLLTDLQDLGFGAHHPFPERVSDWTAPAVSRQEVLAVQELLALLEEGARPSQILVAGPRGAARLLGHLLAGLLDDDYRQSFKLRAWWQDAAGQRASLPQLGHRLVEALMPTRGQLDVIYGKPSSAARYLLLRLVRPLDLALRAARSALAWRRVGRGARVDQPATAAPTVPARPHRRRR